MLSNNHKSCSFSEQIVEYIYDEISAKERTNFESHLINCLPCADEIAGFGLVRSSIGEWRKEEIFALDAPALQIPVMQTVENEKSSWFDEFRKLFTLTPAWAAGFAVLLVCVGLVWMFFGGSTKQDFASNSSNQILPVAPIITNESNNLMPQPKEEKAEINPKEEDLKNLPQQVQEVQKKKVAPKVNSVRVSNNAPKQKSLKPKLNESYAVNLKNINKTNNIQKQNAPTLSEVDGDEDNSLRLSELFDEVGSN